MCATVFYRKLIKGRIYPKAARTGAYAYANEVSRVGSKVVSTYIGILRVPEGENVVERRDVVETEAEENVIESGGEGDADKSC